MTRSACVLEPACCAKPTSSPLSDPNEPVGSPSPGQPALAKPVSTNPSVFDVELNAARLTRYDTQNVLLLATGDRPRATDRTASSAAAPSHCTRPDVEPLALSGP